MSSERFKVFFDFEMTSLKHDFNILSLGIVSEKDDYFYAEFTDYNLEKLSSWTIDNVLPNLIGTNDVMEYLDIPTYRTSTQIVGNMEMVRNDLISWLYKITDKEIEFWGDVLSFDWVAMLKVIADYDNPDLYPILPNNVFYIPFDIATLMRAKGIDPDINREQFVEYDRYQDYKHNALWDAFIIKKVYEKINGDN